VRAVNNLIVAILVIGGVAIFLMRGTRTKDTKGINIHAVSCPRCGTKFRRVRLPRTVRQALWGGNTCAKTGIIAAMLAVFYIGAADASQIMIVRCSPPTGINLGVDTERDKPQGSNPEVFDSVAGGYLSHPRNTTESIITVNQDGTATETSFFQSGSSLATEMQILGKLNDDSISFTSGTNGMINVITLYPKDDVGIFAGTSYIGWKKAIPTGYVYIARCQFSKILP
jgi:hypothetical protein